MPTTNPLDIIKRLDVKQNVTIRVIDEPTGKVVQEHVGHNAATNSLLTGIAHYLMGDGVLNQGSDTLSMWVPQYISLGTMGLTSQNSETITVSGETFVVPAGIGYTPEAPEGATDEEKELNAQLRFTEYINQAPGFGADGYDENTNNNREWFGLGYPYTLKPDNLKQDFFDAGQTQYDLSQAILDTVSVTIYPDGVVNQDIRDSSVTRQVLSVDDYEAGEIWVDEVIGDGETYTYTLTRPSEGVEYVRYWDDQEDNEWKYIAFDYDHETNTVTLETLPPTGYTVYIKYYSNPILLLPNGASYTGRIAIIYTIDSEEAVNCELIQAKLDNYNNIVPLTLRSKITYRDLIPEIQSEVPNTLDVIYSAMVSTGALKEYRGDNKYIYITEAGLWSKPNFSDNGDNGLLAGYRIMPSDDEVNILGAEKMLVATGEMVYDLVDDEGKPLDVISIDSITCDDELIPSDCYTFKMTTDSTVLTFDQEHIPEEGSTLIIVYRSGDVSGTWKDMTIPENRQKVQQSIIRVGVNQVAQIVWKIQLGGLEQLNGLRYLYPPQYPEDVWNIV
jgi:hypothetical protein